MKQTDRMYNKKEKFSFFNSNTHLNHKYYKALPEKESKIKRSLKEKLPTYIQNLKDNGDDIGKLFDSPINNKKIDAISYIRTHKINFPIFNQSIKENNHIENKTQFEKKKIRTIFSRVIKKSNSFSQAANQRENNLKFEMVLDNCDQRNCISCCCKVVLLELWR